jgi:hypothetical protein
MKSEFDCHLSMRTKVYKDEEELVAKMLKLSSLHPLMVIKNDLMSYLL